MSRWSTAQARRGMFHSRASSSPLYRPVTTERSLSGVYGRISKQSGAEKPTGVPTQRKSLLRSTCPNSTPLRSIWHRIIGKWSKILVLLSSPWEKRSDRALRSRTQCSPLKNYQTWTWARKKKTVWKRCLNTKTISQRAIRIAATRTRVGAKRVARTAAASRASSNRTLVTVTSPEMS